ncbi:MAG: virulence RhuM family protein [Desulfobacterales bacterium]|nr:virulence RhuM family protein [Desulfobacterales bacterium]
MNKNNLPSNQSNFLLYTGNDGDVNVEVFLKDETIWLTQKAISELYGVQRPAITKHLKNIFDSGELQEDSVSSILEHTASDGKKYKTKFYNLDAIISVGYRVNCVQATQFRIWATKTLKEFIIKGFVLDDERFKQCNQVFGKDCFDKISTNSTQIHTLQKLRDALLPKLMSGEVRVKLEQHEAGI